MDADVAAAARLIADRSRASIVGALLSGRALTAGELARLAGIKAATASSHLRLLLAGRVVAVESQGRHRYYRLADARMAAAFEALQNVAPLRPAHSFRESRIARELRFARTCYDHLAGEVAVAIADALVERSLLTLDGRRYRITESCRQDLERIGIDLAQVERQRRQVAYPCLDWSERRHHVGGGLGAALYGRMVTSGWLEPQSSSRAVRISPSGAAAIRALFGVDVTTPATGLPRP